MAVTLLAIFRMADYYIAPIFEVLISLAAIKYLLSKKEKPKIGKED